MKMNQLPPEIQKARKEALEQIRNSRPQKDKYYDVYRCHRCGSSGDRGFALWHSC